MKAWQLEESGSISNLKLVHDAPEPVAGKGEVVLEMLFAALNPADRYLAEGQYPGKVTLPHVLGRDGVGRVIAAADDVKNVPIGSIRAIVRGETGVTRWGTFAERVAVPADSLIEIPPGWSIEQTAGASLVYLTAYQAITQWNDLPGECVTLITGASGGVGVASTQLSKAMGHRVVVLSRDAIKRHVLSHVGAEVQLDPSEPAWPVDLVEILNGRKIDLAIDNVGGEGFNKLLGVMNFAGRVSCVGRLAGPVPNFNTASLFFRRLKLGGVAVGTYTRAEAARAWEDVLRLMKSIDARPLIDSIHAFEDLPKAFDRLQAGPLGKVLLRVK